MNGKPLAIFVTAYSLLLDLGRRIVSLVAGGLARRRGWNLDERQRLPRTVRNFRSRSVIWVHAASLGEAKLLARFLAMLEARNPDDCYVLTATTRTGVDYLSSLKNTAVVAIGFLPIDTLPLMRELLRSFSISRVWLLETELWPSMLHACFTAGIPVGIANARMEEHSFANYRRLSFVVRPLLYRLDVVLAQNETYAERFLQLGVRPETLHIIGNMKSYIRIQPATPAERRHFRAPLRISEQEIILTAGCLHKGEGSVISGCLAELTRRGHACRCIVVPRRMEEAGAIAAELGPAVSRFTDTKAGVPWRTCMIEKMGILEGMYRIADAAIVGGTFIDLGGHNVWEPARFGVPVFFGPHFQEQQSSCEKLLAAGVGFKVTGPIELADAVERALWTDQARFRSAAALFAEQVNLRQKRTIESLIP